MYQTKLLNQEYYGIFRGVYNDFRNKCATDYKIEPLAYDDFVEYSKKGIVSCILLLEDDIPTGFLAYSTSGDEIIELFVIHTLGNENVNQKKDALVKEFIIQTTEKRNQAIVSYPLLGVQADYKESLASFNFGFVDLAVMNFDINDKNLVKEIENTNAYAMPIGYKIVSYGDIYKDELVELIYKSFKNSTDVYYDPRFGTIEGCRDIAQKVTQSIYGRFFPHVSKVVLHENKPVGFCLANLTAESIGNIPLVGMLDEHRGLGLSKLLLRVTLSDFISYNHQGLINLTEINASVDENNFSAFKMYQNAGFTRSYGYPQAYLSKNSDISIDV